MPLWPRWFTCDRCVLRVYLACSSVLRVCPCCPQKGSPGLSSRASLAQACFRMWKCAFLSNKAFFLFCCFFKKRDTRLMGLGSFLLPSVLLLPLRGCGRSPNLLWPPTVLLGAPGRLIGPAAERSTGVRCRAGAAVTALGWWQSSEPLRLP